MDWVNVAVVPSESVTVKVWFIWLPLTAVASRFSAGPLPGGGVMVGPAALTASLASAGPRPKGAPPAVRMARQG